MAQFESLLSHPLTITKKLISEDLTPDNFFSEVEKLDILSEQNWKNNC